MEKIKPKLIRANFQGNLLDFTIFETKSISGFKTFIVIHKFTIKNENGVQLSKFFIVPKESQEKVKEVEFFELKKQRGPLAMFKLIKRNFGIKRLGNHEKVYYESTSFRENTFNIISEIWENWDMLFQMK